MEQTLIIFKMNVKVLSKIEGLLEIVQGNPITTQMGNEGPGRRRYLPKSHSQRLGKAGPGTRASCLSLSSPVHQLVTSGVWPRE